MEEAGQQELYSGAHASVATFTVFRSGSRSNASLVRALPKPSQRMALTPVSEGPLSVVRTQGNEIAYLHIGRFSHPIFRRSRVWRVNEDELVIAQPTPGKFWIIKVEATSKNQSRLDDILSELSAYKCEFDKPEMDEESTPEQTPEPTPEPESQLGPEQTSVSPWIERIRAFNRDSEEPVHQPAREAFLGTRASRASQDTAQESKEPTNTTLPAEQSTPAAAVNSLETPNSPIVLEKIEPPKSPQHAAETSRENAQTLEVVHPLSPPDSLESVKPLGHPKSPKFIKSLHHAEVTEAVETTELLGISEPLNHVESLESQSSLKHMELRAPVNIPIESLAKTVTNCDISQLAVDVSETVWEPVGVADSLPLSVKRDSLQREMSGSPPSKLGSPFTYEEQLLGSEKQLPTPDSSPALVRPLSAERDSLGAETMLQSNSPTIITSLLLESLSQSDSITDTSKSANKSEAPDSSQDQESLENSDRRIRDFFGHPRFTHPLIPAVPPQNQGYMPRPNSLSPFSTSLQRRDLLTLGPQSLHTDVTTVGGFIGWRVMNRIIRKS